MRVVSPLPAFVQPQVTTRPLLIYVSGSTFGTVVLLHGRGLFCVTTGHSSPSRGCHAPLNTEWIYNAVRVSGQWNLPPCPLTSTLTNHLPLYYYYLGANHSEAP